jgi:hypothetical protein
LSELSDLWFLVITNRGIMSYLLIRNKSPIGVLGVCINRWWWWWGPGWWWWWWWGLYINRVLPGPGLVVIGACEAILGPWGDF